MTQPQPSCFLVVRVVYVDLREHACPNAVAWGACFMRLDGGRNAYLAFCGIGIFI
jgi:hypothetical protein